MTWVRPGAAANGPRIALRALGSTADRDSSSPWTARTIFALVEDFCRHKLAAPQKQPDSRQADIGSGCAWISSPSLDAECLYDGQGELREVRIGKRFVSPKRGAYCGNPKPRRT